MNAFLNRCMQHLQLIEVELQEEKLRLLKMLVMLLLSIAMLACSLIAISALILIVTWDTQFRLLSIGVLAFLYIALTGFFWSRFSALEAKSTASFADSTRELKADLRLVQDWWDV